MCNGATWRWMEPESERWGECREKEGRSNRDRRSSARCYCPVCQLLEGKNKENWWTVAYHMSVSLSQTLCSVIHSHSQYIHCGRCVTLLHLSHLPTPTLYLGHAWSFTPIIPPTTYLVYPLQIQTISSDAGGRQAYRCSKKRMKNGGRRRRPPITPQVRRSLQGRYTTHLSLGAREGWIERKRGVEGWHTCLLGNSPLDEWGTSWKEKGERW